MSGPEEVYRGPVSPDEPDVEAIVAITRETGYLRIAVGGYGYVKAIRTWHEYAAAEQAERRLEWLMDIATQAYNSAGSTNHEVSLQVALLAAMKALDEVPS